MSPIETPVRLSYSPGRTLFVALATIFVLATINATLMVTHYQFTEVHYLIRRLFNLSEERSIGTWVSAALLGTVGILLVITSRRVVGSRRARSYWLVLGLGFLFLSLDEVAGFHEKFNTVTDFSWTLPGAVIAAIVGLAYIPFLRSLPARTRWLFIIAGIIYLGGALGMEQAAPIYSEAKLVDTLEYRLITVIEETMEMTGAAVMLYAVLSFIAGPKPATVALEVQVA